MITTDPIVPPKLPLAASAFAKLPPIHTGPVHVIYHAHCADGFAAALVAWQVFGASATYTAASYGDPLPQIADGARVFIVDFSYPRPVLETLAARCAVQVLDHHATAAAALCGLTIARFEEQKSGAVMAWEFFREYCPDAIYGEVPKLLLYVQDRDLWKWELPQSREVNAALATRPRTFEEWDYLTALSASGIAQLAVEGKIVLRVNQGLVESIAKRVQWNLWAGAADGIAVGIPTANTPVLQSEVCQRLLELHPEAPWAATYFDQEGLHPGALERVWSLRSRGEVDVSAIAKANGAGGHHNAAGYTEQLFPADK